MSKIGFDLKLAFEQFYDSQQFIVENLFRTNYVDYH